MTLMLTLTVTNAQNDRALVSDNFIFNASDQCTSDLASLFPAEVDILALQVNFPDVEMHEYAHWLIANIPVSTYNSLAQLRQLISSAQHIYIYTDGSLPHAPREDQAPAFALVIFFQDRSGFFSMLGFLGAQLRHCGSIFHADFPPDSTLTEFAGIVLPGYG